MALLTGGRSALADLGGRLVRWRAPLTVWSAALLGPVTLWLLVVVLTVLLLWTSGAPLEGQPFALLLLDCLLMSMAYTWLLGRSQGSALLAVVLHGGLNTFAPPYPVDGEPILPVALTIAVKAVAALGAGLALRRGIQDR